MRIRSCRTQRPGIGRRRWSTAIVLFFILFGSLVSCKMNGAVFADTLADTDFGQGTSIAVFQPSLYPLHRAPRHAMFVTLYEDGRQQVEVHKVFSDEVVGFSSIHPTWHLDEQLSVFAKMPVYVKEVRSTWHHGQHPTGDLV